MPNQYPTTLQLLTDFNSVEIPASVSIRSNRYKKHNSLYSDNEQNEVFYPDYFRKQPDFLESPRKKFKENDYEHDYHSAYIPLKNDNSHFLQPTRPPRLEFSTKSFSYSSNTNDFPVQSHSQPQTLGQLQSQTPSRPLTLGHMPSFGDFLKSDFTTVPKKRNVHPHHNLYAPDQPPPVTNEHSYTHQERDSFPYSHVKPTPKPTEYSEDYSYGSSENVDHSEAGNQGSKSSSFIHNSAFDTFKTRNKKQVSHQSQFASQNEILSQNNEQSYSAGFTGEDSSSPFSSFGQSFRPKRKPEKIDHQKQPQSPGNPYGNYAEQNYETYPTSHEQQDNSYPGNYQYSHQNQPETGYVNLPHHSDYQGGSFDENTSPSPYGDKFAQTPATPSHYSEQRFPVQYETTLAPYADKFAYKSPVTTPSPVTAAPSPVYSPQNYISNEISHSPSHVVYPRPPRQSSFYENYDASTKRNVIGHHGYEENASDVYNHQPTSTVNYFDHSQYPDYSQNEVSNYPTTVAPKIRFETPKPYANQTPKPNANRHKKHISGVASSSYSSSSSPHAAYQTIVDHNDIIPAGNS